MGVQRLACQVSLVACSSPHRADPYASCIRQITYSMEKEMKARIGLFLLNPPAKLRLALVLVSLAAMALGSGAPDDWGYSGWVRRMR